VNLTLKASSWMSCSCTIANHPLLPKRRRWKFWYTTLRWQLTWWIASSHRAGKNWCDAHWCIPSFGSLQQLSANFTRISTTTKILTRTIHSRDRLRIMHEFFNLLFRHVFYIPSRRCSYLSMSICFTLFTVSPVALVFAKVYKLWSARRLSGPTQYFVITSTKEVHFYNCKARVWTGESCGRSK
jgi:hypothetical protein